MPLPYAEPGYGYPEEGQSLIDVTNGKLIRLLVDDEPFDVRYGTLERHERVLDLRDGVLRREVEWTSPAGQAVRIRSTRLVSFVQRAMAAIRYEVEALDRPARIVVQSTLVANEPVPEQTDDPRAAAALRAPLVGEYHATTISRPRSGIARASADLRMAAALDHVVDGPEGTVTRGRRASRTWRGSRSAPSSRPGRRLRVVKLLAYGWSSVALDAGAARSGRRRARGGEADRLGRAPGRASAPTSTTCGTAPTSRWRATPSLQQAVRFALFQVVQAAARAEQRAIPAKGLTGRGYDGHTFWDMETYTLPVLTYTAPGCRPRRAALAALDARPGAGARPRAAPGGRGVPVAHDPRRGVLGYWPAGTAAFHINADIADAVRRYVAATGDTEFERGPGARAAGRDGAPLAVARAPRRRGPLPHRRRDRPRRVHGARSTTTSSPT